MPMKIQKTRGCHRRWRLLVAAEKTYRRFFAAAGMVGQRFTHRHFGGWRVRAVRHARTEERSDDGRAR